MKELAFPQGTCSKTPSMGSFITALALAISVDAMSLLISRNVKKLDFCLSSH